MKMYCKLLTFEQSKSYNKDNVLEHHAKLIFKTDTENVTYHLRFKDF